MDVQHPIRKYCFVQERILSEASLVARRPVTRIAGIAVFANPCAGQAVEDLSSLFELGEMVGGLLTQEIMSMLTLPVENYGKGALVGMSGDLEHGHAIIHPRLGRAMRAPIGGGAALIPSMAKVCSPGSLADVPLGNKDDAWRFSHFDSMTVCIPDGPRPDELALIVVLADGGRPVPRIGEQKAA